MYENTREPRKRRTGKLLYIFLGICIAFCTVTACLLGNTIHQDRKFKRCIADLSRSTSYAYEVGSATAFMNGASRMISGEDVHEIYALLANSRGRKMQSRPEASPEVWIDYGDGSLLEFWPSELENASNNRAEGLLIHYRNQAGESCCYDTDRLDIGRVKLLLRKKIDYISGP